MLARTPMSVGLLAVLAGLVSLQVHEDESEQTVAPRQIPESVRTAVEKAVAGIVIEEAEVEAELIFELEGAADGKEVEIELTAEGQVIRSGAEADDDDDQQDGQADAADESESDAVQDEEEELEIPVSAVPAAVMDAAKKTIPGFAATEADVRPCLVYEVEGAAADIEYEIEVTSEGHVLEVVKEIVQR